MTANESLALLVRLNLLAAVGIAAILILRGPVRALFGSRVTYALWLLAPAAMLAGLIPGRTLGPAAPPAIGQTVMNAPVDAAEQLGRVALVPGQMFLNLPPLLIAVWIFGVASSLMWLIARQGRFAWLTRNGSAGPAVSGFINPRIVLPDDFERRFDAEEREVVLAHEQTHLVRQDARINGLVALIQCAFWFNPLLHLAARTLRMDQELACDAVVAERYPASRGHYAQAMLKTQLANSPLPLGCYWPGGVGHPLTERIAMLKRPSPTLARRGLGLGLIAAISLGAGYGVWASQPARSAGVAVSAPPPTFPGNKIIPGLDVLPGPPIPGQKPPVPLVSVLKNSVYLGVEKSSSGTLVADITRAYPDPKHKPIAVRADRNVPYSDFLRVMNLLQDAGFDHIDIIAEDM